MSKPEEDPSVCQNSSGLQDDLMDLIQLFTLSLCCWWAEAARSQWTDKPWLIVSSEIEDGETVKITCTLPIDYTGGECRLYRNNSPVPFRRMTTTAFLCIFYVTSSELLGPHPVGSRVKLKCNYHLQQYTSVFSDTSGVTVVGSSPSPVLSVSRRLISSQDSVEVSCVAPVGSVASCQFYRDNDVVARGSCSRNLTGVQLSKWKEGTVLLPANMTCTYHPHPHLEIISEHSNSKLLFVVDVSQFSSSSSCTLFAQDDEMLSRNSSWTFVGAGGVTVDVQVTNSSLTGHSCSNTPS